MLDHLRKLFIASRFSLVRPKSRRKNGRRQVFYDSAAEQLEVRQMLSESSFLGDSSVPHLFFDLNFDNRFARYDEGSQYEFNTGQLPPTRASSPSLGETADVPNYVAPLGANASTLIQENFVLGSGSLGGSATDDDKVLQFIDTSNSEKSEIRFFIRDRDKISSGTAILRWDILIDGGFSGKTGSIQFRMIDSNWGSLARTVIGMDGSISLFADGATTSIATAGTGYELSKRIHFEWRLDLDQDKSTLYLDSADGRGLQFVGAVNSTDIDRLRGVRIDSNGQMKVALDNIKLTWIKPNKMIDVNFNSDTTGATPPSSSSQAGKILSNFTQVVNNEGNGSTLLVESQYKDTNPSDTRASMKTLGGGGSKVLVFKDNDSGNQAGNGDMFVSGTLNSADRPTTGKYIVRWDMLIDSGAPFQGEYQFQMRSNNSVRARVLVKANGSIWLAPGWSNAVQVGTAGTFKKGFRHYFEWALDLDGQTQTLRIWKPKDGLNPNVEYESVVLGSPVTIGNATSGTNNMASFYVFSTETTRGTMAFDDFNVVRVPSADEQGLANRARAYQLHVNFSKNDLLGYKAVLDKIEALGYNTVTILPDHFRALSIDANGKVTFGVSSNLPKTVGEINAAKGNLERLEDLVQYARNDLGLEAIVEVRGASKMGRLLESLLDYEPNPGVKPYENLAMDPSTSSGIRTINPFFTGLPGGVDPYNAIVGGLVDKIVSWYGSTPPSKIFLGSDENDIRALEKFAVDNASEYVNLLYENSADKIDASIVYADLFNRLTDYLEANYPGTNVVAWGDMFLSSRLGLSETERATVNDFWADTGPDSVSRWKLDGNAGDAIGSNNGNLQGNPTWISDGVLGGAIDLDGNGDYVAIPDNNTLDITDKLTLSAWVNPDDLNDVTGDANQFIVAKNGSYFLDIRRSWGDTPHLFIKSDGNNWVGVAATSDMKLIEGQWNHVAGTYDASTKRATIYVNGVSYSKVLNITGTGTISSSTSELRIGEQWGHDFDGQIDDVRVYNKVLSASQLEKLSINIRPKPILGWQYDTRFLIDAGAPFITESRANRFGGAAYKGELLLTKPDNWVTRDGRVGSTIGAINYLKNRNRIIIGDWQYELPGNVDEANGGAPAYPSVDYFQRMGFADVWGSTWYNEAVQQNFSQYNRDRLGGGMIATVWTLDWKNSNIQEFEQPHLVNSLKFFSDPDFVPPTEAQSRLTVKWGTGSVAPTAKSAIHANLNESIKLELALPAGLSSSDVGDPKIWLYDRYGRWDSKRNDPFSKNLTWNSSKGVFEVTIQPSEFSSNEPHQANDVMITYEYKQTGYLVTQYRPLSIIRTTSGVGGDPIDVSQSANSGSLYSADFSSLNNNTIDNRFYRPGGDYGEGTFIVTRNRYGIDLANNGGLNTNWPSPQPGQLSREGIYYAYPNEGIYDEILNNGMELTIDFTLTGGISTGKKAALFSSNALYILIDDDNRLQLSFPVEGAYWSSSVGVWGFSLQEDAPATVTATYAPNLGTGDFGLLTLTVTQGGNSASASVEPFRKLQLSKNVFGFGNRPRGVPGGGVGNEAGLSAMSVDPDGLLYAPLPALLHKIEIQRLPVSRWKLDGNANDDTRVGSGNDGVAQNGVSYTSGAIGMAANFDGANDFIEVADDDTLDITDKLTLAAWVNPDDLSAGSQFIVSKNGAFALDIRRSGTMDVPHLYIKSGSTWKGVTALSSMKLIQGQWNHVAATYDASTKTATIYVNGTSRSQTLNFANSGEINETSSALQIGMQWNHYFNGQIDDVRIYNRVLDANEITLLGSPGLRAAGPEIVNSNAAEINGSGSEFELLVEAATAYWLSRGADANFLAGIDIRVTNLSGNLLGMAQGSTLWIDSNAAGYGWFVDQTPWDSAEFGNDEEPKGMDLLSVLVHEMGHLLDQDHAEEPLNVMLGFLDSGERLLNMNAPDVALTAWWLFDAKQY